MKPLFAATAAALLWAGAAHAQNTINKTTFSLVPNTPFLACLAMDGVTPPVATVTVTRGNLNDMLTISVTGLKPNLTFDLFTVQRSPFLADGSKDPDFPGTFGLAWYQSDLDADANGNATISTQAPLRSIFLDQIFGFDGDKNPDSTPTTPTILPPTNTYHVGFWFNMPSDAANCGFDVNTPTPFNGEHKAGPLAMITLPVAATNLGPLCVSPEEGTPCNPPEH
jgi:hypothetical protein